MEGRITKVSELPDWFDTNKYSAAVHLDARGWYEQIVVRRHCHWMVWYSDSPGDIKIESDFYGFKPADFLLAVRSKPIFKFFGGRFHKSMASQVEDYDNVSSSKNPPGISAINAHDLESLILQLEPQRQEEFLNLLRIRREHFSSLDYERKPPAYPNWFFDSMETSGFKAIKIDPILPDKVLKDSFALYLSSKLQPSESFLKAKPKRSNMFLEWRNCGLLQYMDLAIWSIETDTSITNKVLAHGIFPKNYEKGEENIRTTTQRHAERILDDGIEVSVFIRSLQAYAALEDYLASQ